MDEPESIDFSMFGHEKARIPPSPPRTPSKTALEMRREAAEQRTVRGSPRPRHTHIDSTSKRAARARQTNQNPSETPSPIPQQSLSSRLASVSDDVAASGDEVQPAAITPITTPPPRPCLPPPPGPPLLHRQLQRSRSAPHRRSPKRSFTSQAVTLGVRPPWDNSPPCPPPYVRTLAAEEMARKPLPAGMNVAALQHYLEKVTERVRCTGRRVERTIDVLDLANEHAMRRYSDSDAAAASTLSQSFVGDEDRPAYVPSYGEWKLLLSFERLGKLTDTCAQVMFEHRERLIELTYRLTNFLERLEGHRASLEIFSQRRISIARQHPPTAATDLELFRIQADANAASEFEQHVRVACGQAVEASRSRSASVESAVAERDSALHDIAFSPQQRLLPAARMRSVETGIDGVITSVMMQSAQDVTEAQLRHQNCFVDGIFWKGLHLLHLRANS